MHVESFTAGIVATHRLSDAERRSGVLAAGVDLAGFPRRTELELAGGAGAITVTEHEWAGPDGWLAGVPAGAVLALVTLIRSVYDDEIAEPWLPVPAEDLVLGALLRDPAAFAAPVAPLSELLDAAGLHARGSDVAHEDSVWDNLERVQRSGRLLDQLGPGHCGRTALHVMGLIDDGVSDAQAAREVLDGLSDPAVLEVVPNELLGLDDDPERLRTTGALAQRLLAAASRPTQQAVAHWLTALVAERRLEVIEADSSGRKFKACREHTFSQQARLGGLVCARAVPDGESHQFIGGIFAVAPGIERALLDLLDDRDGLALLAYVAELHRPLTCSDRVSTERASRPDLVADVGVLGDQVQSSAGD